MQPQENEANLIRSPNNKNQNVNNNIHSIMEEPEENIMSLGGGGG